MCFFALAFHAFGVHETNDMSVTQVIEHKPYDHRADVFSYAIVLWELLTGEVRLLTLFL